MRASRLAEGVAEGWGGELDVGGIEEGLGSGELVVDGVESQWCGFEGRGRGRGGRCRCR